MKQEKWKKRLRNYSLLFHSEAKRKFESLQNYVHNSNKINSQVTSENKFRSKQKLQRNL